MKGVTEAQFKMLEEIYKDLGIKNGERRIYKLARNSERKTKELNRARCFNRHKSRYQREKGELFYDLFNLGQRLTMNMEELEIQEDKVRPITVEFGLDK